MHTLQASGALQRYGMHLVVANLLHNRKDIVTLVEPAPQQPAQSVHSEQVVSHEDEGQIQSSTNAAAAAPDAPVTQLALQSNIQATRIERPADELDIERLLVHEVVQRHKAHQQG